MAKNEKTILDTDETILDAEAADATLPDDVATMPDDATVLDGEATSGDESASPVLEQGASLLDTYRIESDAIEGGMGAVWRVHHTGWNVDLAMKRPKSSLFQSEKQKENFVHECEAWINLGLHPYIVSCYYVREIGNVPSIFSEWMDGGSLKNAIEDERLYEGNAAERILDIAIQFARGLHYAHEQGLIHQDIKPDNLLLTKAWDAKVADFGIAKARATLTVLDADIPTDATIFSASGGYTPAYCSMEQMRGEPLTRRTDIYSWAVSVMEMYLGERPWQNGVIAGAACEEYFPDAKVTIPQKMQELLKKCLDVREAERPHDFAEVEKRLLEIYREETKEEYPRPVSKAAADTADSLNNRALSFLDLGKPDEAERCWERAFALHGKNRKTLYNHTLYQLLYDRIPPEEALNRYRAVEDNSSESNIFLSQLYALCGNWTEAKKLQQDISVPYMARWQAELAATPNCRCALSFDGTIFLISANGQVLGFSHILEGGAFRILLLEHNGGQNYKFLPYTTTTWGKRGIREFQLSQNGRIIFFCERTNEQRTRFRAVDTRTGRLLCAVELDAEVSAMLLSRDDQVLFLLGVDMQLLCRLELSNFSKGQNPYVLCRVTSSKENLRHEGILRNLLAEFEAAFEPFDFNRCWDSIRRMVKDVPGFDGSELYLLLTERIQAHSKKGKFIGAVLKQVFAPGCAKSFYLILPSGQKLVRIETDIVSYATAVEPIDLWHMDKQELIALSLQGIANYSWFKHIDNTYSSLCEVDETRFIYAGILYEIREEGIHPAIKIHPCTRKPNGNSTFPVPVCVFPDRSSILNGDVITDFADSKKSCLPSEVLAGNPRCIRIASDGGRICYANSSTRDAAIFDCAKRAFTIRFEGHTDKVVHAEFLQNDTLVITLGQDKTMRVYDACTGENLKVMKTNIGKGICLVKSHDERCVLAIGEGMKAELWDITAYELLGVLQLSSGKMKTACFSPDDTQILIHNIEKGGAWLYALEYEYILK